MPNICESMCQRASAALGSGIGSGVIAAATATVVSAAALLGREILEASGNSGGEFSFKEIVLPAVIGSTVIFGGGAMLLGAITGKAISCTP
jgi:hypothetical protein